MQETNAREHIQAQHKPLPPPRNMATPGQATHLCAIYS